MMHRRGLSDLIDAAPHALRQYALLADGERGALVGPRGDIAFMCAPGWHDDAVFSTLLGGAGMYVVRPADDRFVWGGHYDQDSLIWRSRWITSDSEIECREALAFPGDPDRGPCCTASRPRTATLTSPWRSRSGPASAPGR